MIPTINTAGAFTVRAPFALLPDTSYQCKAIEDYVLLSTENTNVFELYYSSNGLTQVEYKADLGAGEKLITLVPDSGVAIKVPSSFIVTIPGAIAVPYRRAIATFDLGILPNSFDLSPIMGDLKQRITDFSGAQVTGVIIHGEVKGFVDEQQHAKLEVARLANITYNPTLINTIRDQAKEIEDLRNHISGLESLVT